MPGTIHVTVLEFKGVSSSSKPSAKSLKVSMGKRQYQTWDKGSFSFPITKIRENLVVALLDAGGNEIVHQDIRTIQIIEKGSWDEVFSINGGGHVHMKLQFTLSEEDRNHVRVMRESVMKKKLETEPNIKLRFQEAVTSTSESMKDEEKVSASAKGFGNIDLTSRKVEASQAVSSPASSAASLSSHHMDGSLILDNPIPNATEGNQGASFSSVRHETEAESSPSLRLTSIRLDNEEAPSLSKLPKSSISDANVKKTPNSVRKMISAFENSQLQQVKIMKRAASVPSQLNRMRKENFLGDQSTKTIVSPADNAPICFKDRHYQPSTVGGTDGNVLSDSEPSQAEKELASTVRPNRPERTGSYAEELASSKQLVKDGENPADLMRQSAAETAISSESRDELSSKLEGFSESSVAEGSGRGRGRETGLKSSTMINIQMAQKTLENYKEECHSAQSSGMWIFPDNMRRLCITTAGEQVLKIVGRRHSEAKTRASRIYSELQKNPKHEKEHKMENSSKKVHQLESGSGSASSPNDSSNGLIGQVIEVAVIVGFGVLVFLTRQKEPRKKHNEEKDNLFHISDYVDERTLKPWTGKQ